MINSKTIFKFIKSKDNDYLKPRTEITDKF